MPGIRTSQLLGGFPPCVFQIIFAHGAFETGRSSTSVTPKLVMSLMTAYTSFSSQKCYSDLTSQRGKMKSMIANCKRDQDLLITELSQSAYPNRWDRQETLSERIACPTNPMRTDEVAPRRSRAASVGLWGTCLATAGLWVVAAPFLRRFSGAPYVSSSDSARRAILSHLDAMRAAHGPGLRVTDLGSGSGEIVLGAATRGFRARGVELNPWLVLASRVRAFRAKGDGRTAEFRRQCLWRTDARARTWSCASACPASWPGSGTSCAASARRGRGCAATRSRCPGWTPVRSSAGVHFYCVVKDESGADVGSGPVS